MNDRLNQVVERLLSDRRFLRRFRRKPERALKPYGLTSAEVAAVKSGSGVELVRLGLDPRLVCPQVGQRGLGAQLLMRTKRLTPALVLAALALPAAPALAADATLARVSGRNRVARVSRYFGGARVAGRFYSGLARTREAGRVTSLAATRTDATLFQAQATGAAREFGIQPPPPPDSN